MSNVRFDELELMLMAMFEQPTLKDTIQVLLEVQPLVAEDAEMAPEDAAVERAAVQGAGTGMA